MLENKKIYEERKRKRERIYILIVAVLLIILFSLQLVISRQTGVLPFPAEIVVVVLININLILLLVLVYLIIRNFLKVLFEYKGIGSKIKYKLVLSNLILSILPGFLLFTIASTFITTSIERWFNIQLEKSLDESLKVAKTFYKNSSDNALFYARSLSNFIKENKLLNQENLRFLAKYVGNKKREYNLESVEVFSSLKEPLVKEIPDFAKPTDPQSSIIQDALNNKETIMVEESATGDIIRASVPIYSTFMTNEPVGVVVVSYYIPHSMVSKMQFITETYEKYSKLLMFKKPLKSGLVVMLLITTLIVIFISISFGIHMANRIIEPLDYMTEASINVSSGNLSIQVPVTTKDEIGQLAMAFNKMLADLKQKNEIIESQSNYLRILMNKVSTGIISFSPDFKVLTINEAFKNIFEIKDNVPSDLKTIFSNIDNSLELIKIFSEALKGHYFERILTFNLKGKEKYLKVDIYPMYDEQQRLLSIVGVFDDITENIRFQKMLAWREVARKVAHEIKNPLTPIQLSANRLKKKYEKLIPNEEERKTFNDCIDVIITQVEDIKNLINEFSNFGRMPVLKFNNENINNILNEVYLLFKEAHKNVDIKFFPDEALPEVYCDREQLKRAFINIMKNAVEAIEQSNDGKIVIKTYFDENEKRVLISISDNGKGIKDEYKERLFEPYFSRKQGGTGLGLYIVNNIVTEHGGFIKVSDVKPKGSEFIIYLPIERGKDV
ncbi:MAG: ATP-binding protein [Proteobacteria bacterium]|nr:ATP-binding protein [Pseudomonadota bacterium]